MVYTPGEHDMPPLVPVPVLYTQVGVVYTSVHIVYYPTGPVYVLFTLNQ